MTIGKCQIVLKTIICVAPAVPDREGGRFDIAARALPLLRDLVPRPTLFAQLRRTPHRLKARPRRPPRQAAPRRTPLPLQLPLSLQRVRKHPLESVAKVSSARRLRQV